MKANELRIGNLILCNDVEIQVENVSEYGINAYSWSDTHYGVQSGGMEYSYEFSTAKIEGIPLTEDWIIKLGGKNGERGKYYEFKGYDVLINCSKKDHCFCLELSENNHKEIKYVHQLQNLYFALTNEELEIKI
jgi:hypothetical protein